MERDGGWRRMDGSCRQWAGKGLDSRGLYPSLLPRYPLRVGADVREGGIPPLRPVARGWADVRALTS